MTQALSHGYKHFYRASFSIVCIILLSIMMAACGERKPGSGAAPEIPVNAQWKQPPLTLAQETVTSSGLLLTFNLPADQPAPSGSPVYAVCLPPGIQPTLRLAGARLGGEVLLIGEAADLAETPEATPGATPVNAASSHAASEGSGRPLRRDLGQLEYVGILRFWSIYRLALPSALLEPCLAARDEGHPLDYSFDLAVEWPTGASGASAAFATPPAGEDSGLDRWRKLAARLVVNPEALGRYRQLSPALYNGGQVAVTDPHRLWPGARRWARMLVGRDGLYRLDPDELIKAGFASEQVRIEDVRIFSHGEPVPVMMPPVPGLSDWFEPGVYFVGRQGRGEYSAEQVYWVTIAPDLPPAELPLQSIDPEAIEFERNPLVRMTASLDRDNSLQRMHDNFQSIRGLHWVDAPVTTKEPFSFGLSLEALDSSSIQTLDVILNFFISETLPFSSTRVEVLAGGEVIDRLQFYHTRDLQKRVQVPESAFRDGLTTLTLRMTRQIETQAEEPELWFDRAEVVYPGRPRLFDQHLVLEPWKPEEQLGWTPLPIGDALPALALDMDEQGKPLALHPFDGSGDQGPGIYWNLSGRSRVEIWARSAVAGTPPLEPVDYDDLIDETQGCDYLIITHPEFREEAERLAEHRRAKGWRVRVTGIQNVYDAFSNGEQDPRAIRDLLAYSLCHWGGGAPDCVLLVGDCSNDYLNVARNDVRNWVPTYTYTVGSDHWASDYWLTTVAGEDDLGDFMIGRLSVANRRDAAAIVDKIIEYDEHPRFGPWRAKLGYVADNGEFADTIRDIRREDTPPAFGSGQMFLDEQPLEDNWYLPQEYVERKGMKVSSESTAGIIRLFREGVTYLTYYGHGSPNIWSDERIWFGGDSPNSDNQHLAGSGYYTFVANMTCNTGTIDYPMPPWNICITEDLMRVPGGGAIACLVPSGPGVTSIHRHMSDQLRRVMFNDDHVRSLGELTTLARFRYALNLFPRDLLYMYVLLGDPALDLQMTSQWTTFEPPQAVLPPGGSVQCVLTGLEPPNGLWTAQLADEDEKMVWESAGKQTYSDGRLPLDIPVPKTAGQGEQVLHVYAWNPQTGKDMALGTKLRVELPLITLKKIEPGEGGGVVAELVNDGKLPGNAALRLNLLMGKDRRELVSQQVAVPAGSSQRINLDAPASGKREIQAGAAYEVVLDRDSDPVDWAIARREVKTIPAALSLGQAAWVPSMCWFELKENSPRADVRLTAGAGLGSGEDTELWASLLDTNGNVVTSRTLSLTGEGSFAVGEGVIPLAASQMEQIKGGRLILSQPAGAEIDRLDLDTLTRVTSRLRIVPETIAQRPASPTEGQTVYIDFIIENNGQLPSGESSVALLDNYMDQEGQLLENQQKTGWVKIPVLGPGRRYPLSLRWDPLRNAGETQVFIQVVTGPGMISNDNPDLTCRLAVKALTKPALSITKVWSQADEAELKRHQITLYAEIGNAGQTTARRVLVTFYRSEIQTEENVLGEVEVDAVPGDSSAQASLVWEFDPARDLGVGMTLPTPTVQLRLKGSSQRVTSVVDEGPS